MLICQYVSMPMCKNVNNANISKLKEFEKNNDDYNSIMLKALADRLAEALAEYVHEKVRKEYWGYDRSESLDNEALINEEYTGIRPAPGYPACPEHTVKEDMFRILECEDIGMSLTESYAMFPGASVSGFYFAHPESKYFTVGKIGEDQLKDMAMRRHVDVEDVALDEGHGALDESELGKGVRPVLGDDVKEGTAHAGDGEACGVGFAP